MAKSESTPNQIWDHKGPGRRKIDKSQEGEMIEGQSREAIKDALSIQGGLHKLKGLQKERWM